VRKALILSIIFALPSTAIAHKKRGWHRHHQTKVHKRTTVVTPGVTVHIGGAAGQPRGGPWNVHYVPTHRAGYTWVSGYYMGPRWHPGHWQPVAPPPRTNVVYVIGHWEGDAYNDGYWRDETNEGHDWNDGYYDDEDTWVEGGWVLTTEDGTELIIMDDTEPIEELEAEHVEEMDVMIIED